MYLLSQGNKSIMCDKEPWFCYDSIKHVAALFKYTIGAFNKLSIELTSPKTDTVCVAAWSKQWWQQLWCLKLKHWAGHCVLLWQHTFCHLSSPCSGCLQFHDPGLCWHCWFLCSQVWNWHFCCSADCIVLSWVSGFPVQIKRALSFVWILKCKWCFAAVGEQCSLSSSCEMWETQV